MGGQERTPKKVTTAFCKQIVNRYHNKEYVQGSYLGHSGDAQQKSNYDFSSLPYGDLNYLTMPLEEEMPIEPLVEINTDSTAEINTDSAARINTDSTAETNTDSTTGNNTNSSQNNSEPALQTQVLTTNEVPSNNQIVTNNVEIKQKEVIDCA